MKKVFLDTNIFIDFFDKARVKKLIYKLYKNL